MKYNRSHLITIKYDITHQCHIKFDTGDECHVFEEAFNMDGTLRLHISQPVNGWISKLTGLITKISIDKSTKIPVSGEGDMNNKDREKQKQKEKGREKDKENEKRFEIERSDDDQWAILERMDDDLEHWGGSEIFRKEDRFFGTLQGPGYQVIVVHVLLHVSIFCELYFSGIQWNLSLGSVRDADRPLVFGFFDDDEPPI